MRTSTKILLLIVGLLLSVTISALSQSRYELTAPKALVVKSYNIMLGEVGFVESGNNRGIADKYNRAIGNSLGASYCQAGQYWCYKTACDSMKLSYHNIPMPKNGLANSTFDYAKRLGTKTAYIPQVHDFIIWKSVKDYTGHIERIILVQRAGWVQTVGFNTGSTSQDNGEGVFKKKRNIRSPLTRIKIIRGLVGVRENY